VDPSDRESGYESMMRRQWLAGGFASAVVFAAAGGCTSILGNFTLGSGTPSSEGGVDAGVDGAGGQDVASPQPDALPPPSDGPSEAVAVDSPPCGPGDIMCAGMCVATASDMHNCGRCAHDCLGGQCSAGVCSPQTIISAPGAADLALDATHLFWISPTGAAMGVFQVNLTGGNVTPLSTTSAYGAHIVVHGTSVYWSWANPGNGAVQLFSATVGVANAQTALSSAGAYGSANGMIYNTVTNTVWIGVNAGTASGYGVLNCPLTSGACTVVTSFGSGRVSWNLVTDGNNAYFGDQMGGVIEQAALQTGDIFELVSAEATPDVFAMTVLSNALLYWGDDGSMTIRRMTPGGSNPTTVANTAHPVDGLVADGVNAYWTDSASGTLSYAPIGGAGTTTLYVNQSGASMNPMRMVSDGVSLIWLFNNSIYRVAFP
jgi:hypothetical protein